MAEDRSLRARLGLSDDRMNPLLKLAEAQASKAPGLALLQLERLAKASFESSRLEVERLKKRYGEADERWKAREAQGVAMKSLLALIARGQETLGDAARMEPMTVKGAVKGEVPVANLTIEIAEDSRQGWVAARTLTNAKGAFEVMFDAPAEVLTNEKPPDYLVLAREPQGALLARSETFPFAAGKSKSVGLEARRGRHGETGPGTSDPNGKGPNPKDPVRRRRKPTG